jgi:hypothetical protein
MGAQGQRGYAGPVFSRRGSSPDAGSSEGVQLTKGARKSEAPATGPADSRPEGAPGKGRPTPTRKEAEQRRREAIKPTRGGARASAKEIRKQSAAERAARLEGIKRGDERYLHARDKGPLRAFARDTVDSRLTAAEFFLPLAVIVLLCSFTGSKAATALATNIWAIMVVVIGVDLYLLIRRMRKMAAKRFPTENRKGLGFYTMMRALTLRRFRAPAPRVERGAKV